MLVAASVDNPLVNSLDPGERSAIALGLSLKADLILIDERKGATVAATMGLETTGTLGILDLAARRNLIDPREAIERLTQTNCRYRKGDYREAVGAVRAPQAYAYLRVGGLERRDAPQHKNCSWASAAAAEEP